jgi:hypothetical protein
MRRLDLLETRNAQVEVAGQPGRAAPFAIDLADRPTQLSFLVQREQPGRTTHVAFAVFDDCGRWNTFVGSGTSVP